MVTILGMVCIGSLAAGITTNSRICYVIMHAATKGFTGVLGDSIWFNLEILFDGSLFADVTESYQTAIHSQCEFETTGFSHDK